MIFDYMFSPQVQPMIPTPTHGSLPSGHATEAFLMARLLWKLLIHSNAPQYKDHGYWGQMLMRQAARIATNRTVAGVHFPIDSVAGGILGLVLAEHVCQMSCGGNHQSSVDFNAPNFDPEDDFDWHKFYRVNGDKLKKKAGSKCSVWLKTKRHHCDDVIPSPILKWLWDKALEEWKDL